jgi:hypothetical protein
MHGRLGDVGRRLLLAELALTGIDEAGIDAHYYGDVVLGLVQAIRRDVETIQAELR